MATLAILESITLICRQSTYQIGNVFELSPPAIAARSTIAPGEKHD